MPQQDRHRNRIVEIEYETNEMFSSPMPQNRMGLFLITNGSASFLCGKESIRLSAPAILLLSEEDHLELLFSEKLAAKSFYFVPSFLNHNLPYAALRDPEVRKKLNHSDEHDLNMLQLFLKEKHSGVFHLTPDAYVRIAEWFSVIGTEVFAQSDGFWTCRIRRYLLQILYLLHEMSLERNTTNTITKTPEDIVLAYIHTNYANEISLTELSLNVHMNRTTLNKRFKARTGKTIIAYLLEHRLKIACELLQHTNLRLIEVAASVGFHSDTYLIRQFTKHMGMTPTEYRRQWWGDRTLA